MGVSFDIRADPKQSLESNAANALHHHDSPALIQ